MSINKSDNIPPTLFIADSMLGKLAKWLRLFGFDVVYYRNIKDPDLINKALKENRVVLTRDTNMILRKEFSRGILDFILIESDLIIYQLKQVLLNYRKDSISSNIPRCNICNSLLKKIKKSEAKNNVPPYVHKTQNSFSYCPKCKKFFWPGTHWKEIEKIKSSLSEEELMTRRADIVNNG